MAPPNPLPLVALPFAFSQDGLLSTSGFLKEADARGIPLDLTLLAHLHEERLLVPLYLVDDESDANLAIPAPIPDRPLNHNATGWALIAAVEGRLRDAWLEERPGPYESDLPASEWWDGYVWSPWQLLEVRQLVVRQVRVRDFGSSETLGNDWAKVRPAEEQVAKWRARTMTLAALSTAYLPNVLGRLSSVSGDFDTLISAVESTSDAQLLAAAGADATSLRPAAEVLLGMSRHFDPLRDWLPLLRHIRPAKWLKLKGEPLDALWHRIAAEVLLACHESLADAGLVEALPTPTETGWWGPLDDRLARMPADLQRLEPVLADFGLTPNPAVLLLVEGPSELEVVPTLLEDLGIGESLVRVQSLDGVGSYLQQVVRYGIAPKLGRFHDDSTLFLSPPTALRVLLDPEGRYADGLAEELRKLRKLVRDEIERQGHSIEDSVLEKLVDGEVFDECFEFANFAVDELLNAALQIDSARETQYISDALAARSELEACRDEGRSLKPVLGPWRISKPALAHTLLPVLQGRLQMEAENPPPTTPVLRFLWATAETARSQPRGLTTM